MATTAPFSKQVKSGCRILAVLLGVLVVTLPVAIWFWVRQSTGRLLLDDDSVRVLGLGFGESVWRFNEIERLGVLRRRIPKAGIGGAIAARMSGGREAVNLCAQMKGGKVRYFMLSRYENHERLLEEIVKRSKRPLEGVKQGMGGPKFVRAA